jgi:prepilin-type N-terminal cleavage/methylation domain-containing protein
MTPRLHRLHSNATRSPGSASRASRGFTLVELMVALTAGLFVSIIVFMLARDGARFYQGETRVANATLAGVMGFERLRSDLSRAGFMSSPNIRRDPSVCGDPAGDASWPLELGRMASLRIDTPPAATSALSDNGRDPDRIVLSGSYSAVDEFPMWGVTDTGSYYAVALQPQIGELGRMGYAAMSPADQAALLSSIFGVGRALRIVDPSGKAQYGTIKGVVGGASPEVDLSETPILHFRGASSTTCGLSSNDTGYVNVVNFVQYQIESLAGDKQYAPLYDNSDPWDAGRTELVRQELDVTGKPIDGTEEVVAEYAVDLRFGLTVVNGFANPADPVDPTTLTYEPGNAQVLNWAGDTSKNNTPNQGPELVRAVRVRLSVRSRDPDRQTNVDPATVPGLAAGFYRMGLGPNGTAPFARVRTLQSDVSLTNQLGVMW